MDDPCIYRAHGRVYAQLERLQYAARRNPCDPRARAVVTECAAELDRIRRRLGNPTLPRLQHVAKTFPRPVLTAVIDAWGEATGLHSVQGIGALSPDLEAEQILQTVAGLATQSQIPDVHAGHTRYDRYLPWLGAQLAPLHRKALRAARRYARESLATKHEGHAFIPFLEAASEAKDLGQIQQLGLRHRDAYVGFESIRAGAVDGAAAYRTTRDAFRAAARLAKENFRVITEWADATGTDLGKVELKDAAERAVEWARTQEQDACTPAPQGEVVYRWQDGWTVQELTTPAQLQCEGALMRHCVGDYCADVARGDVVIYSLRDAAGKPYVTMEWDPARHVMLQIRAFANRQPTTDLILRIALFREGCPLLGTAWTQGTPAKEHITQLAPYQATYVATLPDKHGKPHDVAAHIFSHKRWARTRHAFSDAVYDEFVSDREQMYLDIDDQVTTSLYDSGLRPCDEDDVDEDGDPLDEDCVDEEDWLEHERRGLEEVMGPWEEDWEPNVSVSGTSLREHELNDLAWRLLVDGQVHRDGSLVADSHGESADDDELLGAVVDGSVVLAWMRNGFTPSGPLDRGEPVGRCKRRTKARKTKAA